MSHRTRHRRSIRLPAFDYASTAVHFVTLCVHGRSHTLGDVAEGRVVLSDEGRVVDGAWQSIIDHRKHVSLDAYVIMPDHVHGLIAITSARLTGHNEPLHERPGPPPRSLGAVIGAFKAVSSREINRLRETPGGLVWQRNFYEHIVRSDQDLQRIREYIQSNPARWHAASRQT